ncbi:MAG: aspartate kinase [Planctomycetota bacterium]
MKFGGTSLGDAERVRIAAGLVKDRLERRPFVVVSAHGSSPGPDGVKRAKVTDLLIQSARKALAADPLSGFSEVQSRHYELLDALGLGREVIEGELGELNELLRGVYLVKELTPRTLDYVMSFGERMSARALARELVRQGVSAAAVDSYDLGFITDSNYGSARPLADSPERIARAVAARDEDVIVTTGFIGRNAAGEITTVGRQGSDYSASYFGAALDAEEVQIWTDVDGVLTADPSVVPEAMPLDRVSFREAAELAYYGAEVLHPQTMIPAVRKGIPIRVLNTFRPESPGTIILPDVEGEPARVKSVVYKEDITLINVVSTRMLGQAGFMAHLFEVFGRHNVVIDMIATSEISLSLTTDRTEGVEAAAQELRDSEVAEVVVEPGKAVICVVGSGMKHVVGMAARVFQAIAAARVNIQMISQGASEINIALLVDNDDIASAVKALHADFFEGG